MCLNTICLHYIISTNHPSVLLVGVVLYKGEGLFGRFHEHCGVLLGRVIHVLGVQLLDPPLTLYLQDGVLNRTLRLSTSFVASRHLAFQQLTPLLGWVLGGIRGEHQSPVWWRREIMSTAITLSALLHELPYHLLLLLLLLGHLRLKLGLNNFEKLFG